MSHLTLDEILAKLDEAGKERFWKENSHLSVTQASRAYPAAPKPAKSDSSPVLGVPRQDLADFQAAFMDYCEANELPVPIAEHRFAAPRRFRFDYAWLEERLALEVNGGVWSGGRHTRGGGFIRDMEKATIAAGLGWRMIYCQPEDLCTQSTLDAIRAALAWSVHKIETR